MYRRRGEVLLDIGDSNTTLYLLRRGAVDVHDRQGSFVDRYGEGESFGLQSLLTGKPVRFRVIMIEDGLVWMLPRKAFDDLRGASPEFGTFYLLSLEERLISALQPRNSSGQTLFMTPMRELLRSEPVAVAPESLVTPDEPPPPQAASMASETARAVERISRGLGEGAELRALSALHRMSGSSGSGNRLPGRPVHPSCSVDSILVSAG